MSSITAAVVVLIAVAIIYVAVVLLSHKYNRNARDRIDPTYSISQWDPSKVEIIGECAVPLAPTECVIEGLTGAYQAATHWCRLTDGPCIDPDTGESVKGNPISIQVICSAIPYCSWSEGIISFDDGSYVYARNNQPSNTYTLENVPGSQHGGTPTLFFMERLSVGTGGLVHNQNGTIARFYMIPPGSSDVYVLSYTNNALPPGSTAPLTRLSIEKRGNVGDRGLTMFVLMESMPTMISSHATIPGNFVRRKILVFGGSNVTQDPGLVELADFNDHIRDSMWKAAQRHNLIVVRWETRYGSGGFYGDPNNSYTNVLNNWDWDTNSLYLTVQNVVESRLLGETGNQVSPPFYNWLA